MEAPFDKLQAKKEFHSALNDFYRKPKIEVPMEPSFDYNQFKAQNQLHNALRAFAENLRETTNAANVRNFPTVQGQPLPFEQLLRDLNIETQQAAVPDFDFEFIGVTLAAVEAHCLTNNLNFMTFTQNRGNKLYYNAAYNEQNPRWVEMSRPEASDVQQEFSELIFLDIKTLMVDWRTSLDNLKRLSTDRRYTEQMMHACLLRLINKFIPEQTMLQKPKTSNEIAQFLLQLDSKVDKLSFYKQQLFTAQRNIGEELDAAMARFRSLLDKVYPENVPEPEPQPGASGLQRRQTTPRPNISSLTQSPRGLNLTNQDAESSESSDESDYTIKEETVDSSPEPQNLPEVDYNDLNSEVDLIPTATGLVCVLQGQQFSVINTPRAMLDHPRLSQAQEPRGINFKKAVSSTPAAAGVSKAKPTRLSERLLEKTQAQESSKPVTRAQSNVDKQSGNKTRVQARDASLNAINFNIEKNPANQNKSGGWRDSSKDRSYQKPRDKSAEKSRDKSPRDNYRDRPRSQSRDYKNRNYSRDQRDSSRDKRRDYSRDRDNRNRSRDYSRNNRSRDRYNNRSRDRYDNHSRDQYDRKNSRDRNDSNRSRDRYNQNRSRDRRDYLKSRGRDDSRGRDNYNQPRSSSNRRSDSRNYSRGRSPGNYRDNRWRSQSPRQGKDQRDNRAKSRDSSVKARSLYPEMKRGENCGYDYNPMKTKFCRKCPFGESHHEFTCFSYEKYNNNKCTVCGKYNHFAGDCREVISFPPKLGQANCTGVHGKN